LYPHDYFENSLLLIDFVGNTSCQEALVSLWSFTTTDACNPVLQSAYSWDLMTSQCSIDLKVTNTSTGYITWFTPELTYTELISIEDGGKKRIAKTTTLTRDYVSEYPQSFYFEG
jgi:hypothetical protein